MVRAWYLSKAMFLTAKTYKINWYGYLVSPLLAAIPIVVLAWYGQTTWNTSEILGLKGLTGYLGFLLVGVAYWSYVEVLWSAIFVLRKYMRTGQFEDLFLTPVNGFEYILGWTVFGLVKVTLQSFPLIILALTVNAVYITFAKLMFSTLVFVLSIIASFGLVFLVFGITLIYKDGEQLASLIGNMAPLIGGLYFPVSVLPGFLKCISYVFPFTWGIDLMRNILLDAISITSVSKELFILIFLSIGYLAVGSYVYKRLQKKARYKGVHGF